jgi:hypothetical protein
VRDEQGLNRKGETGEMGAHLWFYFVPYEPDINRALQALRKREFIAGRYHPAIMFPQFPVSEVDPRPSSAAYASIEEALEASQEDGTRSILDMERIGEERDYGVVSPVPGERLTELFGTPQPTREMIEQNIDFFEDLERGKGIYIIVFKGVKPAEIFFAGYSYD